MRSLRARLAPGQRVLAVIVLGAVLGAGAVYLAAAGSPGPWSEAWFGGPHPGAVAIVSGGGEPGWLRLAIYLIAIAAWAALSLWLLAGPGGVPGGTPDGPRPARLGTAQRAVVVVGLGVALAAGGFWSTALTPGPPRSYAYAPLTASAFGPPAPGLPGWARALIWLAALAAWAAVSWRLLGRRPAAPHPAGPAPEPE